MTLDKRVNQSQSPRDWVFLCQVALTKGHLPASAAKNVLHAADGRFWKEGKIMKISSYGMLWLIDFHHQKHHFLIDFLVFLLLKIGF
jgi:hypothetical protein